MVPNKVGLGSYIGTISVTSMRQGVVRYFGRGVKNGYVHIAVTSIGRKLCGVNVDMTKP